jgi:cobalamin biosynthesis Mg chelatase CobN
VYSSFDDNLQDFAERGKMRSAYHVMIAELGKVLASDKKSFVDLLNESGVSATLGDSPRVLANKYVDNICENKKLMLGTSLLLQMKNQTSSADGETKLSDEGVKTGYFVMRDYLSYNGDQYSNLAADPISAVAQGVGELAKLSSTAVEGGQKLRYAKKYGALDKVSELANKREETRLALIQAQFKQKEVEAEAQKKKEENSQKTNRTILIVTGVIVVLAIVGAVVYKLKK